MQSTPNIRCFVSLDLPPEGIQLARNVQNSLRTKNFFKGKFTEPSNIHLTLKFLGEITDKQLIIVKQQFSKIKFEPITIRIKEIGVFSRKQIRIIWLKVEGADQLQKQVDQSLRELFDLEDRFMGHITIARVKQTYDKSALLDYLDNYTLSPMELIISEFNLKQSILTPSGPEYKTLQNYKKSKF